MTARPMLSAEQVTKRYPGTPAPVIALDAVNLSVAPGELLAITGRSGSGKTSLLNVLGGLDRPDSGRVLFLEHDLATMADDALTALRRGKIGYVFQSFGLLTHLSAEENVELPLRIGNVPQAERQLRLQAAFEQVGLSGRRRHRPNELSGGEKQRVAVARALVSRPSLLLADEPTAELDSTNARHVFAILRAVVDAGGAAMIVATHDRSILDLASTVREIRDGRLLE